MKNKDCIAFTGGGTAGHIFPGIAVINELRKKWNGRVFWLGSRINKERKWILLEKISFYGLYSGKLRRYLSFQNILDVFKLFAGFLQSLIYLKREKPLLLFSKGGYVSVPPVLAAKILKIPVITHESDLTPGMATLINSRFANKILISFKKTFDFFNKQLRTKLVLTGNPVRQELLNGKPEKGRNFIN